LIFNATIVNHSNPAVSVQVADAGGVTYSQIKQSLGSQVYNVNQLYLFSPNTSQLIGTIKYQIYDSTGNQNITNIATTVNPYQNIGSLLIDLKDKINLPVILNGNSSLSTTIAPQTYLQVMFITSRITNAFGQGLANFMDIERVTNTNFFEDYGSPMNELQVSKKDLAVNIQKNFAGNVTTTDIVNNNNNVYHYVVTVASVAAISAGIFLIVNNIDS